MRDKVPRHKKANMWLLFLMWCAIIASVPVHHNGLEAFALPSTIKRLPDIFWNTSNPIFRIDNTDHIIDVNQRETGNPHDVDRINIVCPVYDKTEFPNLKDTEQFVIYHVTKEEYDTCYIRSHSPRIIAQCNHPYRRMEYPISFRSFSPMPNALEYKPGKDYHFISTSSKDDLHLRIGGMCLSNNMKLVFKVGKRHEREPKTLSDNNIGKNKNKKTVINQLNGDVSSNNDGTLEGDILPSSVNKEKVPHKVGTKGRKHRERRKNGERKKNRRKNGKKRNHNKDNNPKNRQHNDLWESRGSTNFCPPGGCSQNGIENQGNYDYKNTFRNNDFDQTKSRFAKENDPYNQDFIVETNRYGDEMPSKDIQLMNDKPRGIVQDQKSDVEKVHDLMRQEPSISASSSAPINSPSIIKPAVSAINTFLIVTILTKYAAQ